MLPPCSIHGMWGSRKISCDGLANKDSTIVSNVLCDNETVHKRSYLGQTYKHSTIIICDSR